MIAGSARRVSRSVSLTSSAIVTVPTRSISATRATVQSEAERERLVWDLLEAVDHETRALVDLLGQEEWDLFACAFGHFQCVGHNFWGFADSTELVSERLRTAMLDVYSRVDDGIGALRSAAGPRAVVAVFASHGMGPLTGGVQLVPEVLVGLGLGSGQAIGRQRSLAASAGSSQHDSEARSWGLAGASADVRRIAARPAGVPCDAGNRAAVGRQRMREAEPARQRAERLG